MYYMLLSYAIVILAIIPFFRMYEKRKPKAREVVLIAMYTAITVTAQIFFHVTVPIQIETALTVIAGISMGPQVGFLIGALARLICNFYMGQGPWTPWQMLTYGMIGFMAGLAFNKAKAENKYKIIENKVTGVETAKSGSFAIVMGPVLCIMAGVVLAYVTYIFVPGPDNTFWGWRVYAAGLLGLVAGVILQKKRLPIDNITLTVFTFFVTVIIYGGIMNMAAMFTSSGLPGADISWNTMRLLFVSGLPYDLYHAGTAAIAIFVIGKPMIQKIERIKIKYGIYR